LPERLLSAISSHRARSQHAHSECPLSGMQTFAITLSARSG
jgi:hypothetical protein